MKILLDCDGVLADFVGATLDVLRRDCGLSFTADEVTRHDICTTLRLPTNEVAHVKSVWRSLGFASSIEPYPEALAGVESLKKLGEIVVVTAPMAHSLTWAGEREQWLAWHFGLTDIISTREKQHVVGDVMIDDMMENLLTSPARSRVLFRRPWNVKDWSSKVHYVDDWQSLVETIDALSVLSGGRFL